MNAFHSSEASVVSSPKVNKIEKSFSAKRKIRAAFTLIETMVATAIFATTFTVVYFTYGQSIRMLDGLRQQARAEDILLSNIEFLRTRNWTTITNLYTTTAASNPSQTSSNLTESINVVNIPTTANSPVCTHLELINGDPLRIGLKNPKRDLSISPNPLTWNAATRSTTTVFTVTVSISWDTMGGRTLTNSMATLITKGGMTADTF